MTSGCVLYSSLSPRVDRWTAPFRDWLLQCKDTDTPNSAMTDLDATEQPALQLVGGAVFRLDRRTLIWAMLDFSLNLFKTQDR